MERKKSVVLYWVLQNKIKLEIVIIFNHNKKFQNKINGKWEKIKKEEPIILTKELIIKRKKKINNKVNSQINKNNKVKI